MVDVKIVKTKTFTGLEVYKVYINRVYTAEFFSKAGATTYIASKFKSVMFRTYDMTNQ